jgi:hypothetical protein
MIGIFESFKALFLDRWLDLRRVLQDLRQRRS